MDTWQVIVVAILGNSTVVAVLALIGKKVTEQVLSRDIERFKRDPHSKAASEVERFRAALQLSTIEHQVRFSTLHEKRATVIAELSGQLAEAMWAAESFLNPLHFAGEPTKAEKHAKARAKVAEFFRYFDKHRIYLPQELCEQLEEFIRQVRRLVIDFGVYGTHGDPPHPDPEQLEVWVRNWEAIKTEVPKARQALENEFRLLLHGPANMGLQPTPPNETMSRRG
jgi:hypothetical protein